MARFWESIQKCTLQGTDTYPTLGKRKIIDSKVPTGWEMFVVSGGYLSNFWALACPSGTKSSLINSWFTKKLKHQSNIWATCRRLLKIRQLKTNFLREFWDFPDFIWNVDLNLYLSSIEIKAQRTTQQPFFQNGLPCADTHKGLDGSTAVFQEAWGFKVFLEDVLCRTCWQWFLEYHQLQILPFRSFSARGWTFPPKFTHHRLPLLHDHDWPPCSVVSCILKQTGKIRKNQIHPKWYDANECKWIPTWDNYISSWIPIESPKTPWVAHSQPMLIIASLRELI